jgi:hypothetical protein
MHTAQLPAGTASTAPAVRRDALLLALVAATAVIGLAGSVSPLVTTFQAVLCTGAIGYALMRRRLVLFAGAASYIAGSDVLWRMNSTAIPWEGAKYLVSAALITAILRFRIRSTATKLAGLYLLLLVPGAIAAWFYGGLAASEPIREQLAGPLVIAAFVGFFGGLRPDFATVRISIWCALAPIAGVAAITARETFLSGRVIAFTTESNFETSGGFGPNQVSTALSFGALCLLVLAVRERKIPLLVLEIGLGLAFGAQAALTFSRGGVLSLGIGVAAAVALTLPRIVSGVRLLLLTTAVVALTVGLVLPRLMSFTNGELGLRYSDSSQSNREVIAAADLQLFRAHPLGGVGAGRSPNVRVTSDPSVAHAAPHNEFTRTLAEHGVAGVGALVVLAAIVLLAWKRASPGNDRAATVALSAWMLSIMWHAATRVSTVGLALGVAWLFANLNSRPSDLEQSRTAPHPVGHRDAPTRS